MVQADQENPEWTAEMFAKARKGAEALPAEVVAAFPRRRGRQKAPTKKLVSVRLDEVVLNAFRGTGEGWQGRINEALADAARREGLLKP